MRPARRPAPARLRPRAAGSAPVAGGVSCVSDPGRAGRRGCVPRPGAFVVGNAARAAAKRGRAWRAPSRVHSSRSARRSVPTLRPQAVAQPAKGRRRRWRARQVPREAADAPAAVAGSTPAMRTRNAALGTLSTPSRVTDDDAHVGGHPGQQRCPGCRTGRRRWVTTFCDETAAFRICCTCLERTPGERVDGERHALAGPNARDVGFVDRGLDP